MLRVPTRSRRLLLAAIALLALTVSAVAAQRRAVRRIGGRSAPFAITGQLPGAVLPGASIPLDLRLTNPNPRALRITQLTIAVTVDPAHARAGCDRLRDFHVVKLPPSAYPIRLRAHQRARLSELRVLVPPRLRMIDRPANQNACKGAQLRLRYAGKARDRAGASR